MTVSEAPDGIKRCTKCKEEKPLSEYHKNKAFKKSGLYSICKVCTNKASASWYAKNKPRDKKEFDRLYNLKTKFGLTADEYQRMMDRQGGVCAICQKTGTTGRALAVDHDHDTLVIRGLPCSRCNTGLGALGDSVEGLEAARQYLILAKYPF